MKDLNQELQSEEISIKEFISKLKKCYLFLLSKWKIVFIAGVFGGLLGFAYVNFQKPIYIAETTFVLEEGDSGGGLGAYAGLASIAGIDLGGGGGGIFQGDNILQLYKSRTMIQQTLLTNYEFNGKNQTLIDRYIEFNHLAEKWSDENPSIDLKFHKYFKNYNRAQDSIINELVKDFNKKFLEVSKPDKKLSIISVKFNSKDELFAKAFINIIVKKVNDFYIKTKTKKSAENLKILEQQADSVKRVLNLSIGGVASAIDANPNINPAYQTLRVPSQRRQVDVQASGIVYQEITKNLELAKITFRKDQPLIQVIDEPILPLVNNKVGKLKGVLIGALIISFLCVVVLTLKEII